MAFFFFFFQAEDGIRDKLVTGVQTCALPISRHDALRQASPPLADLRPRLAANHGLEVPDDAREGIGPDHGSDEVVRRRHVRSEEHTSELQSLAYLVCRLLLEKKKKTMTHTNTSR